MPKAKPPKPPIATQQGLRVLLQLRKQAQIRKYRGKLNWHGDLDGMRTDR